MNIEEWEMLYVKFKEPIVFEEKTCHMCGTLLKNNPHLGYCSDVCFDQDAFEQMSKYGYFRPYIPLQISRTTPDSKLQRLVDRCKCEVILHINSHRNSYQSVEQWLKNFYNFNGESEGKELIPDELAIRMVETNSIIELHFYAWPPVGQHVVYGTTINEVLDEAMQIVGK